MKTFILMLLINFSCIMGVAAQNISTDTSLYWMYAELIGTRKFLSTKIVVDIDFGQSRKWFEANQFIIDPNTGKARSFNSMVDAMNFMGENGWEFVQAYILTEGQQNVYHWLLKRACRKSEKGEYLPMTRGDYKKLKE